MSCKICGREEDGIPARGKYAHLCAEHRAAKSAMAASEKADRAKRLAPIDPENTFEGKAKSLVLAGRRVDQALADVRLKSVGLDDSKTLARQALEQWRATCQRLAEVAVGR